MAGFCTSLIAGIDANRTLKDELTAAIGRHSARRRLSVTDLVNPMHAYFSRMRPDIKPSPERLQAMMAGTGFHDLFGRAVSTEEFVEQLVEFEEIVGKIDVFEDAPVELKTTSSIPSDILRDRPSHAEQLAMYCAMVGAPRGHLLYYRRADYGRDPALRAFDLEVANLDPIAREMVRRRDLLRAALDKKDHSLLPRCEWVGRDCAYESVCGCDAAAPLDRMTSGDRIVVQENPGLAQALRDKVASASQETHGRRVALNDLVFPRRAAHELRSAGTEEDEEDAESRMASYERRGFEDVLKDAVWYGIPGACRRVSVPFGSVRASVLLLRDVPTLFRTNRRRELIERARLASDVPHYIDRLGFECALTGHERGRLIVYYAPIPGDKFMVYDIWYKDLESIRAEMKRRLDLLESRAAPESLPACQPAWMSKNCKFSPGCGCGASADSKA